MPCSEWPTVALPLYSGLLKKGAEERVWEVIRLRAKSELGTMKAKERGGRENGA